MSASFLNHQTRGSVSDNEVERSPVMQVLAIEENAARRANGALGQASYRSPPALFGIISASVLLH